MGLDLKDQTPVVGKADDAGVILEDRKTDIVFPLCSANLFGGADDVTLEEGVDLLTLTSGGVEVIDARGKDLVFAVLAPGLGKGLDLAIGKELAETDLRPRRQHLRIADIGLNRSHLFKIEGEHASLAQSEQFSITDVEIHFMNLGCDCGRDLHFRNNCGEPLDPIETIRGNDRPALNQAIGEKSGSNLLGQNRIDRAGKEILH